MTLGLAAQGAASAGTTFTVNSTDIMNDHVCDATHCSLIDARDASDANPGKDTIAFDIPGSGPHTIAMPMQLDFTDPVDILGDTQPGWSVGHPVVVIDGTGNPGEEFRLAGGDSTVRGLVIHGNGGFAIAFPDVDGNVVEGNFLGTDVTGAVAVATGGGVVAPGSNDNTIGGTTPATRNVIVASSGPAVSLEGSGSVVEGNFLGTDAAGSTALGGGGIFISGDHARVGGTTGTTPGGPCTGACNVIVGGGIVDLRSSHSFVQGNFIGTDVYGTINLGSDGVDLVGDDNLLGGTQPGWGNVVAGGIGVAIGGSTNRVEGNRIGTDVTGTKDFGNVGGLEVFGTGNHIGGTTATTPGGSCTGACNLISGNQEGVGVATSGNFVEGNYIGTDVSGSKKLGNDSAGVGFGFFGFPPSNNNVVGGTQPEARNVISGNGQDGIVASGSGHVIAGNFIGTRADGKGDLGNAGAGILNGGQNDTISRNVVSGNGGDGIALFPGGTDTKVLSNYIGTDVTGTLPLGNDGNGVFTTSNQTIGEPGAGNLISANKSNGIFVFAAQEKVKIQGNLIGTNAAGSAALGNTENGISGTNGRDIHIGGSGTDEGNLISGNGGYGVAIGTSSGTGNVVEGNLIGTDARGTAPLGNEKGGVLVDHLATIGGTTGTTPGGSCTGACNLISGNGGDGILHGGFGVVLGNLIGTDVTGQTALGNTGDGLVIGQDASVGDGTPAGRNVISSNGGDGLAMKAGRNQVQGNFIGTDATGALARGNGGFGVVDACGCSALNLIGGTAPGAGNVISANGAGGVHVLSSFDLVQGNRIGTDVSGTKDLGNTGHGVSLPVIGFCCFTGSNTIGGTDPDAGNVIRYNGGDGVSVAGSLGNRILRNSIFANDGLGIDLDDDGVTPNDDPDAAKGANTDQNFPVITAVTAGGTMIHGTLTSRGSGPYRIELFSNGGVTQCDASGNGEGETFLASTDLTLALPPGSTSFTASFTVTLPSPVPAGSAITTTATDPDGNTSEFSQCGSPPLRGTIVVRKETRPSGSTQPFAFSPSYAATGFSLKDGESNTSDPLARGSYSVTETAVSGWDTSASCDDGSPINNIGLSAGETVTCTFVNTQRGLAQVVKTVNGAAPSGAQSFAFQLRQGASTTSAGTTLESGSATAGNGGVINFTTKLVPGTTYALCELVLPGWMTTLGPPFYVVYNPSGDNSTVCTDFSVTPGQTKSFAIDNKPPPGGLARTIGFWKNWASCASSKGKQGPVLDQTLAGADPGGITIGTLTLHGSTSSPNAAPDCLKAVRLLDKSTIDKGTKMASDPAFNLAAQLLAAKLNVVAGAGTCPAAVSAINNAQALLAAVHFNGITHDKLSAAQASQANSLGTTLDKYNNNRLC